MRKHEENTMKILIMYIIQLKLCGSITKIKCDFFRRHIIVIAHCSALDGSMKRMSSYWKP